MTKSQKLVGTPVRNNVGTGRDLSVIIQKSKFLILVCNFAFCILSSLIILFSEIPIIPSGLSFAFLCYAQDTQTGSTLPAEGVQSELTQEPAVIESQTKDSPGDILVKSQNVTLDFKDADIKNVLKIISLKSGVNIVAAPDVIGTVAIRLVDVPWERALDVILKTYGYAYEKQSNVILVTKAENISKIQAEEPLQTEIFNLRFLDAQDAQKILIPLLSSRGKISILYTRGQKGWQFGTFKIGKESTSAAGLTKEQAEAAKSETISIERTASGDLISRKAEFEDSIKSKTMIITDTVSSLDRIRNIIIPQIDKKPQQVLIETRLLEVNRDRLKDIGFDWGTGTTGAETSAMTTQSLSKDPAGLSTSSWGGHALGSQITPAIFGPRSTGATGISAYEPYNTGAELIFQKLTGTRFEAMLHALEEDVHTNTLSAPRILTLENQEASILVGYHTPILKSEISTDETTGGSKLTQTLDYYQEIGIRLNVVPQVNEDGYINMIIHPSVTSSSTNVTATSYVGTDSVTTNYPIIDVRETQTQVLLKDKETIVIGGLLKDIKGKQTSGIPFLSKIPLLGVLFRRDTDDIQKIDLLIFITARIVREGDFTPEEIDRLEKELLGKGARREIMVKKNKK
ncbi:MAG: secretin and TonB N-terminal domain-containing protein [Candidatus Omnitrophota bacterium]